MSLPNMSTTSESPSEHEPATRQGNLPRRSTFFFDLENEAFTPNRRLRRPSASPVVMSPDSPLTSSDSEVFQADSPTIRLLDPAHRPSPRAVQALRREHPPLVVISADHNDRIARPSTPAGRSNWRNLRSASSIESFTSRFAQATLPLTSTPYRGSYVEIGSDDAARCSRCSVRRFVVAVVTVSVALVVTAAPSVFLSKRLVDAEADDLFALFREKPEIAIPAWLATCFLLLAVLYSLFFTVRLLHRKYVERRASFEEALQFARETMPEYGLRAPANQSRLGYFYTNHGQPY